MACDVWFLVTIFAILNTYCLIMSPVGWADENRFFSDSDICLLATLMELNSLHRHIIKLFYTLKIDVIYKNVDII